MNTRFAKSKILMICDNQLARETYRLILDEVGCKVTEATALFDALEKMNFAYDLIIIDIEKEGLSSIELIKIYRQYEKDQKATPIILISTQNEENERNFKEAGGNAIIKKPLSVQEVKKVLEQYIFKEDTLGG